MGRARYDEGRGAAAACWGERVARGGRCLLAVDRERTRWRWHEMPTACAVARCFS